MAVVSAGLNHIFGALHQAKTEVHICLGSRLRRLSRFSALFADERPFCKTKSNVLSSKCNLKKKKINGYAGLKQESLECKLVF